MRAAQDFAIDAIESGWDVLIRRGKDTGDNPFMTVEAIKPGRHLILTWHTRATGTYRLFSCMSNKRDTTLRAALEELRREVVAS